jgi:hypothetical protein
MEPLSLLTKTELKEMLISAGVNSIEQYEKKRGESYKDNERRVLKDLVRHRFSDYNKRSQLDKIRKAIEKRELGDFDRFNQPVVSYLELKKYLFGK